MKADIKVPGMSEFDIGTFDTFETSKDKYHISERKGLWDKERKIFFEEDEFLIMSDEKWTAFDIDSGTVICKANSYDNLYIKVDEMWNKVEERRNSDEYVRICKMFDKVLENTCPAVL